MKLKMLALAMGIMISGCSYNLDEVEASKAACAEKGGEWFINSDAINTYCTISGIRYTYHRGTGAFYGAYIK